MTSQKIPQFKRLQPGYYYSTRPVIIDSISTHVVIEESAGGSYWTLRLEELPGMESIHSTKKAARNTLIMMIEDDSLVLAIA